MNTKPEMKHADLAAAAADPDEPDPLGEDRRRQREADLATLARLRAAGFEGPAWKEFVEDPSPPTTSSTRLTKPLPSQALPSTSAATTAPSSSPWLSRTGAATVGVGTSYIAPGSPWETPFVESFNGKARDELFAREIFDSVLEARVLWEDFCHVYNHQRPHSSLGYLPPAVFAAALRTSEPS